MGTIMKISEKMENNGKKQGKIGKMKKNEKKCLEKKNYSGQLPKLSAFAIFRYFFKNFLYFFQNFH